MTKLIRVQENTYESLQKLAGKLQAKHGSRFSLDKTIQAILEERAPRRNAQNPEKTGDKTDLDEFGDSVKWFSLHHKEFRDEKAPVSSTKVEQKTRPVASSAIPKDNTPK